MTVATRGAVAAIIALTTVLTACGSDDEDAAPSTTVGTTTPVEPSTPAGPTTTATSDPPPAPSPAPTSQAPILEIGEMTGRDTSIALDAAFLDALTALGLTPGSVGDATVTDGAVVLPVTGGNLTVTQPGPGVQPVVGDVEHRGSGLSLAAGGTSVELTDLVLDLATSRIRSTVVVGDAEPTGAVLLEITPGTLLTPVVSDGAVVLQGAQVVVAEAGAVVLNQVFGTDAFRAGLLVGVATTTIPLP